ncbi:MAG TPA: hypothetical protein PLI43_11040 [Albidovulum sp.]|uniref:hypothetical protein n=1 Tax=Albidovulum sp. TaxID=1872424 RepID=UPI002C14C0B8|nr:hypothetical protein [Albidovulum sp.]
MEDNTDREAGAEGRSAVEALFTGLQVSLRKEARNRFPALLTEVEGTERFREGSLERLYFAKANAGIIPRGSVVLIPPPDGGEGS